MKAQKILLPIIILIGALAFFSIFIVKEVNQAIVLQFGDPKKIILKPGLNFKIPFIQNVVFLDSRILNLDTPPAEVIASDQKRLIVDAFARFQIVDPLKFYISVGNERVARSRLATIINSRIRNVLGQQELQTLLSKDRSKQMSLIQEGVNAEAQKFGIKIVDVRIKRADLPQANSEAIYRRMQTEREREAKEFRARGAEMAVTITSTADKDVSVLLANANKDSEIATIPIGHADGLSRKLGNGKGYVTIHGQRAPIIGNVCMDMIMVNITEINCKEGDVVFIFKTQEDILNISSVSEAISYEVLTLISQRIKRVLIH